MFKMSMCGVGLLLAGLVGLACSNHTGLNLGGGSTSGGQGIAGTGGSTSGHQGISSIGGSTGGDQGTSGTAGSTSGSQGVPGGGGSSSGGLVTGQSDCERAGGACGPESPGFCYDGWSPNTDGYSCGSSTMFCCLPLSYSPCETAGGTCVEGTCPGGTIDDSIQYECSNGSYITTCCMPSANGGASGVGGASGGAGSSGTTGGLGGTGSLGGAGGGGTGGASGSTGETSGCPFISGGSTGPFNTTGPYCFTTCDTIISWSCGGETAAGSFDRTVRVNGVVVGCGDRPPFSCNNGNCRYQFEISAGPDLNDSIGWTGVNEPCSTH